MKRSRSPTPEAPTAPVNGFKSRKRQIIVAEDDDPYGLTVGAPGFLSKPGGNKGGFVPGYLRVPGSSINTAPKSTPMKTAWPTVSGPGSSELPQTASRPALHMSAQPAAHAAHGPAQSAVPAVPTPAQSGVSAPKPAVASQNQYAAAATSMPALTLPSPVWSPDASQGGFLSAYIPTDNQQSYHVDRRRFQSKDLPEQHRLPDDLPETLNSHAKSATSATGPLSVDMPKLPSFHEEILKFVEQAAPNQTEQLTKAAAFERVAAACAVPFRGTHANVMRVQPFGSYANGLSLAESDIDVVVTGILEPDDERGGWLKGSRKQVTDNLFKIVRQLRKEHAVAKGGSALQIVAGARIPIVKLKTVEGVDVDISLGNDDGVKAADMTKAKLQDFPAARALTIVTKAFLKARRLTDVSTGGLGGYALVNMIIAHLQEEAKGGGKQTTDLGQLFFGFLRRFGSHFNLYTDAVAIGLGGIVSKKSASVNGEDTGLPKLCVQDINTLRDIASASKRITEVNEAFHSSAETLEQQSKTYGDEAPQDGWLQLLFETTPFTMREAAQPEQELPQQSGRPSQHQPRPHVIMAKSQPKQHGDPGFMMRKSGQANHKASFAGQPGTIHGARPNNLASPPPKNNRSNTYAMTPGGNAAPTPSLGSPPAATPPYATPPQVSPLPYPYSSSPAGGSSSHAPPALGLPNSPDMMQPYGAWGAQSSNPYVAAYQYQLAQHQMSTQSSPYVLAQSMPLAHPYGAAGVHKPPGPRPPPYSPPK